MTKTKMDNPNHRIIFDTDPGIDDAMARLMQVDSERLRQIVKERLTSSA